MPDGSQLASLFYNLGRGAGLIGFALLSLLIFSGDTARFFDKFFGMDKIIKFQKKFALFAAAFVLAHPLFFMLSSWPALAYVVPDFAIPPLAAGVSACYIFIIIMIASAVYKRISYLSWQYLHLLNYALFFLSLYHATLWGSGSALVSVKIYYGIMLSAVSGGLIYRTRYKIRQKSAPKFYVKKIKHETNDVFTLILTSEKKLNFKAGQFCFLRLNKGKLYARHPFTISSAPREPDLRFTIKNTGRFTAAARGLKPGEEVIVDGPFGKFTEKNGQDNLVFIAGGVGIIPFISMIKEQFQRPKARNIILLCAARTRSDIIFQDFLNNITADWLTKIYVLSQDRLADMSLCETGHINKRVIQKYAKNIGGSLFYICGPQALKNCALKALIELGAKKRQIITEDFFW